MAITVRKQISPLDELFNSPQSFDFFQAVRLLGRYLENSADTSGVGVNYFDHIKFCSVAKSSFPINYIHSIKKDFKSTHNESAVIYKLYVTFLGLTGPSGVMPESYTEYVIKHTHGNHRVLQDFFDIFNHKIIELLYRVWERNQIVAVYERQKKESLELDLYSKTLLSLAGLGQSSLQNKMSTSDEVIQYYSSLFSHRVHSAKCLESMLSEQFQLPVKVLQFQPEWLTLADEDRSLIVSNHYLAKSYNKLGINTIVGSQYESAQSKFRIYIGPINYEQFKLLSPNGEVIKSLHEITRLYVRSELHYDIQVELLAAEIPLCRLSYKNGTQLGWNTWLQSNSLKMNSIIVISNN